MAETEGTHGKVVAVTGASGGIGRATALLLAERGRGSFSAPVGPSG